MGPRSRSIVWRRWRDREIEMREELILEAGNGEKVFGKQEKEEGEVGISQLSTLLFPQNNGNNFETKS